MRQSVALLWYNQIINNYCEEIEILRFEQKLHNKNDQLLKINDDLINKNTVDNQFQNKHIANRINNIFAAPIPLRLLIQIFTECSVTNLDSH